MNSKQRRREEKRLYSSSQYGTLPPSSIAVSFETVKKMGKDYQSFVDKERKNQDAGANLPEVQSGNSFVIGLNSVMRALERKELQIVVISGKVKKLFVQHLPLLCNSAECQWSTLQDISRVELGKCFGVRRITAFGLRKQCKNKTTDRKNSSKKPTIVKNTTTSLHKSSGVRERDKRPRADVNKDSLLTTTKKSRNN